MLTAMNRTGAPSSTTQHHGGVLGVDITQSFDLADAPAQGRRRDFEPWFSIQVGGGLLPVNLLLGHPRHQPGSQQAKNHERASSRLAIPGSSPRARANEGLLHQWLCQISPILRLRHGLLQHFVGLQIDVLKRIAQLWRRVAKHSNRQP